MALLGTWVRTGQWLKAVATGELDVQLMVSADNDASGSQTPPPGGGGSGGMTAAASAAAATLLRLSLPGSPVSAVLSIDSSTGRPLALRMAVHTGGPCEWRWPSWPRHAEHVQSTGQRAEYVASPSVSDAALFGPASLISPASSTIPAAAAAAAVEVDVARCEGGQFLLRGRLGGVDGPAGWFILDPGCDTSAVSGPAADAAGLPSFGQQVVAVHPSLPSHPSHLDQQLGARGRPAAPRGVCVCCNSEVIYRHSHNKQQSNTLESWRLN